MSSEQAEQEILEDNLDRALAEARVKIEKAVESLSSNVAGYEKDVWAAAEACEYSSLVYSLTYNLEEAAFPASKKENLQPLAVAVGASQSLASIRSLRATKDKNSILEGYRLLREAADRLRTSYLSLTRPKTRTS